MGCPRIDSDAVFLIHSDLKKNPALLTPKRETSCCSWRFHHSEFPSLPPGHLHYCDEPQKVDEIPRNIRGRVGAPSFHP